MSDEYRVARDLIWKRTEAAQELKNAINLLRDRKDDEALDCIVTAMRHVSTIVSDNPKESPHAR